MKQDKFIPRARLLVFLLVLLFPQDGFLITGFMNSAKAPRSFLHRLPATTPFSSHVPLKTGKISTSQLNLFGNVASSNSGSKGGSDSVEVIINGKSIKATVDQKVSQVAASARIPIKYSCRKGDCATCSISLDGRIVKACQEKIPRAKKCVINTL